MTAPPAISLSGTARIDGTVLFDNVDLSLVPGRWTCLLGPSGVGKSTLLRLIAGMDTGCLFDGTITADGVPLNTAQIAYMAQDDLLLPWRDVLGNVTLGATLRGQAADLERGHRLIARLGLEPHLHKRPATLSGGQRQRVALARTLMEDRPAVLLDEPFSALDARTRADMQELATEVLQGRTVLLVTHDPAEAARLADCIYVLESHALWEADPPPGKAIRSTDDPDTMAYAASLLNRLRSAA